MIEDLDPRARELMVAARRFSRALIPHPRIFADFGLTYSEIYPLFILRKAGDGIAPSELAARLDVTAGSVTQQIKALEARGLVQRNRDPVDRRGVRVLLTPKGEEALTELHRTWEETFAGLRAELGDEDCDRLTALLQKAAEFFAKRYGALPERHFDGGARSCGRGRL
jgi:DNA-binding MarR family transcriptional regulator